MVLSVLSHVLFCHCVPSRGKNINMTSRYESGEQKRREKEKKRKTVAELHEIL